MGMKKVRSIEVTHVGRYPHYHYEPRNGIETLVGIEERVQVLGRVTDPGPEHGREVALRMSRTDAENFIRNIGLAVLEGREKERAMGLPDSEQARTAAECDCGRHGEPSPALHAGTCPVWAQHHNLNR